MVVNVYDEQSYSSYSRGCVHKDQDWHKLTPLHQLILSAICAI